MSVRNPNTRACKQSLVRRVRESAEFRVSNKLKLNRWGDGLWNDPNDKSSAVAEMAAHRRTSRIVKGCGWWVSFRGELLWSWVPTFLFGSPIVLHCPHARSPQVCGHMDSCSGFFLISCYHITHASSWFSLSLLSRAIAVSHSRLKIHLFHISLPSLTAL